MAAAALAACNPRSAPAPGLFPDSMRIRSDIEFLASDALEGRGTGTAGNDSAAAFVARRYAALRLREGAPGYRQSFVARSAARAHSGGPAELQTQNVVAILPGADPRLAGQVIVLGAHIDHLGRATSGAHDADAGDDIRNGAHDNASGNASVLELARLFTTRPSPRERKSAM
jgi:hypothetical protein